MPVKPTLPAVSMKPNATRPIPDQLTPASANALVESRSAVIFDLCEQQEFAEEHIAGAQPMPLCELPPNDCRRTRLQFSTVAWGNARERLLRRN